MFYLKMAMIIMMLILKLSFLLSETQNYTFMLSECENKNTTNKWI